MNAQPSADRSESASYVTSGLTAQLAAMGARVVREAVDAAAIRGRLDAWTSWAIETGRRFAQLEVERREQQATLDDIAVWLETRR